MEATTGAGGESRPGSGAGAGAGGAPSAAILAEFSEFGMFFLGMLAAPLALWRGHPALAGGLWLAAVALRLTGWFAPTRLAGVYRAAMAVSAPIGMVVSRIALALVYYLVFTPVALVFKLIGRDALARRFDRNAKTYWEPYQPDRGPERYLRQF